MRQFSGKVAVVTGGASGIGRAMADRFAAEGMALVLADIEEEPLDQAVKELAEAGAKVLGVRTDVAEVADVQAVAERALGEFGAVHLVCNNAGVAGTGIIGTPLEHWQWTIGVDLWGVVHGCNTFLPILMEQNEGHIVNTASLAGLGGVPGMGVYCAAKFAVVGLSESLFYELSAAGSEVGVSVLCPGFVATRISQSERNMPDALKAKGQPGETVAKMVSAVVAAGIAPSQVADAVFDAVRDQKFFVLPHERAALAVTRRRLEWMEGGAPPGIDLDRATKP
jgi:NAD(P)-dependent dehydrogenase (short-subunit alcohol dehydrogenase family)